MKLKKGLNCLSLFDGISCGKVSLDDVGIEINNYYASEVKNFAIKCSKDNHDDIIHIGDVTKISYKDGILKTENGDFNVGDIDLLIGGSPCQDFSILNTKRLGLDGEKSKLFYEFLRLKNEINPKYFLLENVKMKKNSEIELNKYLGVDGIHINSNLLTFQSRPRIYWTNIPNVTIPEDLKVNFQDYKDTDYEYQLKFKVNKTPSREKMWNNGNGKVDVKSCKNITYSEKIGCLTRKQDRSPNSGLIEFDGFCRYLTTREMELAQGLPVGYTKSLSMRQAEDVLGDGWTVSVISHIFKGLK